MVNVGFSREVITPARGLPLVGYFNPRPNTGILDDLFVKVLLFEQDSVVTGLVAFDLSLLTEQLVQGFVQRVKQAGLAFADHLIFSAIHTHTGPAVSTHFGYGADPEYLKLLEDKAVLAVRRAVANLAPAELSALHFHDNPYAFNRRYWMADGKVLTNPGKCNPRIVKPEGPVDDEISVLAVRQDGRLTALVANIVNHSDTIGGNMVSADWPGRMERELQNQLGYDLPVVTLIGCSGNINHFDVSTNANQTSYAEACRIGKGYAGLIARHVSAATPLAVDAIRVKTEDFVVPYRDISDEQVREAEAFLARTSDVAGNRDLTSEGLATGEGPVARFFARELIAYRKTCSGKQRTVRLLTVKLGGQVLFATAPFEPFTEIGLALKAASPARFNFIVALAMGKFGYLPLPECFDRGGYEVLPVVGGGPRQDTAPRLIQALTRMMKD